MPLKAYQEGKKDKYMYASGPNKVAIDRLLQQPVRCGLSLSGKPVQKSPHK